LALFFKQLKSIELEGVKETDDQRTQNWKTIQAYFKSPNKIFELIQDAQNLVEKNIIKEDEVELAEELIMNSQEVKQQDSNSFNQAIKLIYDFIIAFLDYYNIYSGKVAGNAGWSKRGKTVENTMAVTEDVPMIPVND
jgi:hypothetical protein